MTLRSESHRYPSYDALVEDYFQRGWTDGLPIVAPQPGLVTGFLAAAGLPPEAVIGEVRTRGVTVTAEVVAINAVMAGCRPEYLPVVVAATRALLAKKGNPHSTTASLGGPPHVIVVNGPIAGRLGINAGAGCFGPGWRANATIGRALRLVIRNALQAIPGELDRATLSSPGRYSFCFAEDEAGLSQEALSREALSREALSREALSREALPWEPLHCERGLPAGSDAVTVFASWGQIPVWADVRSARALGDALAAEINHRGTYGSEVVGDDVNLLIVIPRAHQQILAESGWSKADLRRYLWEHTAEGRARADFSAGHPKGFEPGRVMLRKPEGILIVAAGGDGLPESWLFFPHSGAAITEPVTSPGAVS
jgi:hypothetical protein